MTTTATRELGWRRAAPLADARPAPSARHGDRLWMGRPLKVWSAAELREILVALELTAYGLVTPSDLLDRNELIQACGEIDAEMDRRRGKGRANA